MLTRWEEARVASAEIRELAARLIGRPDYSPPSIEAHDALLALAQFIESSEETPTLREISALLRVLSLGIDQHLTNGP